MTNTELTEYTLQIVKLVDEELECDASIKIAALKSAVSIIENNITADAMRVALFNALNKG